MYALCGMTVAQQGTGINAAALADWQACLQTDKDRPLAAAQLLPDMDVDTNLKAALPAGMQRMPVQPAQLLADALRVGLPLNT